MTCITRSTRRLSAIFAAGLVACAFVPRGTLVAPAGADEFQNDIRLWEPDDSLGNGKWGGLYFVAPPAAAYATPFTGTPSKYPPPLFYGPGLSLSLDGPRMGTR